MMTKEEFIARQRTAKREENRFVGFWLISFFAILFGNLLLARWMDHHRPATSIQVAYGCLLFGFLFGNLGFAFWITKRRSQKFGLLCPACGKSLTHITGQIAVATGFCGHCDTAVYER